MSVKKIFINQEEEIISIVDKILQSPDEEVTLFFPRGAQIFQSNINLKLLRREADNAEKQITIVTEDESGQKMALKNNFVVFNSKEEFEYYQDDDKQEEISDDKKPKAKKEKEELKEEEQRDTKKDNLSKKEDQNESALADDQKTVIPNRTGAGRVIDLRSGVPARPAMSDIQANKKDDNYFEKLIEEKNHFNNALPGDEDFSLSIDLDDNRADQPSGVDHQKHEEILKEEPVKKTSFFGVLESIKSQQSKKLKKEEVLKVKRYAPSQEPDDKTSEKPVPLAPKKNWLFKTSMIFAVLGLIIVLAVIYFALPKADIFLTLNRQNVTSLVSALADKNIKEIDLEKGNIPAKSLEVSKQQKQTFQATGEKQVNKKATGVITVFNEYSSASQGLVETTRFLTDDGKIFRTTESITVPGATIQDGEIMPSSIDVEVVADQPGEEYNIGPAEFSIPGFEGSPKYKSFYGRSSDSMTGGKIGTVKFVSEQDMQSAITEFSNNDIFDLKEEIKKQVPEGYVLLDECIEKQKIEDKTAVEVGDVTDLFEISFDFSIRAIAFSMEGLETLAQNNLKEANKSSFSELEKESVLIEYGELEPNFENGTIRISANASGNFINNIDLEKIKKDLAGKGPGQVKNYFAGLIDVADGEISFWPFFVRSIPDNLDRIEIFVN